MTCSGVDAETIRKVAARFGFDLTDEEIREYQEDARQLNADLQTLKPDAPDGTSPDNIKTGNDQYNAFRHRFTLVTGSGPLEDLRISIKDNIAIAGVPMTCGSSIIDFTPQYNATVVRRLLDTGATITGTTNMDEFASFATGETCAYGKTENPRVAGCVPGGSSSGSAATVAANLVDAALGSDTAGSIRIPASFCGVVGFKPTYRSVSRFGFADLSPSLDHVGPLADTVGNAVQILDAIAGPDVYDPSTQGMRSSKCISEQLHEPIDDLTIGLVDEAFSATDDNVARCVKRATDELDQQGISLKSVSVPTFHQAPAAVDGISGPEFARILADHGQTYANGTGYSESWRAAVECLLRSPALKESGLRDRLIVNRSLVEATGGAPYVLAQNVRRQLTETIDTLFEHVDVLLTPTTPCTAPEFGEITETEDLRWLIANTCPFNLTGHPAVSVPCGEVDHRPVGVQIVTDWYEEAIAARLGQAIHDQ